MPDQPLIVLKFGGSVLLDELRLRIAVHEIHRWRRDGWRVLAVVSALAGRTDELIAGCAQLNNGASNTARASLIASGELESASLLGVHLDRAGIPARVLSPASVPLVAHGDPLDADPISVNCSFIENALEEDGVVVFPGYVAVDNQGQTIVLGRGGSDLTAVYLAANLHAARCRLIKDVDGLYESDPSQSDPPPKRYAHAGYEDALSTDGSILQHKAIRYAQAQDVVIEVGRFNGTNPTTVGAGRAQYSDSNDKPESISVALCGLGTVGGGVFELLRQLPELFEITGVACKHPEKRSKLESESVLVCGDAPNLAERGADVVVESIGGTKTALALAINALKGGSHLVTANKALVAEHGGLIDCMSNKNDLSVLCSASVGGVVPVLEHLRGRSVRSVSGVLNGTGNFVLGAMADGVQLDAAVREAQERGFAEADPSRDLDGRDALDKLLVIGQTLGWDIPQEAQSLSGITEDAAGSTPVRHVARINAESASVKIEEVAPSDVFGRLQNEWNAAIIEFDDGSSVTLRGKGAGRWPTSESVLGDLLELSRCSCSLREVAHA